MSVAALQGRSVTAAAKQPSSPFGASQAFPKQQLSCRPCQASSGSAVQRMTSMERAMSRSHSGSMTLQRSRSRAAHTTPALSPLAEHGGFLDVLTDPGAANASFDDVCEILGDVAKLDGVTATLGAGQILKSVGSNPLVNWVMEKAAGNVQAITQFTLLEGLIDKTLIDLFQQLYGVLDLDCTISNNWVLRLGVAAAVAFVVRHLVHQYQQQNPAQLERQMSPAASLTDALADSAAAAFVANTVKSCQSSCITAGLSLNRSLSRSLSMARSGSLQLATAAGALPIPAGVSIPTSSSTTTNSKFKQVTSTLLKQKNLAPADKARVAVQSLLTSVLLGQFKRANKLKRQVKTSAAEIAEGRWSPGLLLVLIEAGVLVHNYSELGNGVSAILGLGN